MLIDPARRQAAIQSGLMDSHTRTYTSSLPIAKPDIPASAPEDIKPKSKGGRPKKNTDITPEKVEKHDKVEKPKKK